MQVITNALIRIDGVKGPAPSPMEKPDDRLDFWVWEIALPQRVKSEKAQAAILKRALIHAEKILIAKVPKTADITLYLEFDRQQLLPRKIDRYLVSTIAAFGGNIEIATKIG